MSRLNFFARNMVVNGCNSGVKNKTLKNGLILMENSILCKHIKESNIPKIHGFNLTP